MFRPFIRSCMNVGVASGLMSSLAFADEKKKNITSQDILDIGNIEIISGTANRSLSEKIAKIIGKPLCDVDTTRFSDGEILVKINESMRSKDVFIIQTCGAPVNDNVIELLLSIAAAKRSGAHTVTAVVPYFGYKLNRRELPISTTHHSRFLGNSANDLAKMLHICGVDKVIAVDLQRPGQGHEACFFHTTLPAETVMSESVFIDYFLNQVTFDGPVVIVSPNTENVKKVRKFQRKFAALLSVKQQKETTPSTVEYAAFLRTDGDHSFVKGAYLELLGNVKDADVILLEDYIESAVHMSALCNRLKKEGARRVFVAASHGLFTESAKHLIDLSPVEKVVITDTIALPANYSDKIHQVSVAPLLAQVISSDLRRIKGMEFGSDEDDYEFDGKM